MMKPGILAAFGVTVWMLAGLPALADGVPVRKGPYMGPWAREPAPPRPLPPYENGIPRLTPEQLLDVWGEDVRNVGKCNPNRTEAPCAALGIASRRGKRVVDVGAGNPVNPLTGDKYQMELDAAPLAGALGLEIRRHYNSSLGVVANPLGRGWSFSYDTRLFLTPRTIQIIQADGYRRIF